MLLTHASLDEVTLAQPTDDQIIAARVTASHASGHVLVGSHMGLSLDYVSLLPSKATANWRDNHNLSTHQAMVISAAGAAGELLTVGYFNPYRCRGDQAHWNRLKATTQRIGYKGHPGGKDFTEDALMALDILRPMYGIHTIMVGTIMEFWAERRKQVERVQISAVLNFAHTQFKLGP